MRSSLILAAILPLYGCASTPKAPVDQAESPANPEPAASATQIQIPQDEPPLNWWHEAVFYEVFIRSYQDSNGDGMGDLQGLIQRLDYLNDGDPQTQDDLGVTALWLMPIFESPSYHGYDVVDYRQIEQDYGQNGDFEALIEACHARGIKVIVDLMLNHTSVSHPWFEAALSDENSPHRDWYLFRDENPGWSQPWGGGPTWHAYEDGYYYGIFWEGMPDLNFENPAVQAEFLSIADFWLAKGVDGFRLDAIRHLVERNSSAPDVAETHPILKTLTATLKSTYPNALFIGEIWDGPHAVGPYYGQGDELDLAFDFGLQGGIVGGLQSQSATPLFEALMANLKSLPVQAFSAPFLGNHDMDRLATHLGADAPTLKLGARTLLTLPGTPFIYYGEEIALKNTGIGGDPAKRAPMQWDVAGPGHGFTDVEPWAPALGVGQKYAVSVHQKAEASLLDHYRQWIHLRQAHPALNIGLLAAPGLLAEGKAVQFQRIAGGELALIVHNFSKTPLESTVISIGEKSLNQAQIQPQSALQFQTLWGPKSVTLMANAQLSVEIPALGPQESWVGILKAAP